MPVLDVRKLSKQQLRKLSAGYDAIAQHELSPFPKMDVDPVRQEIDDLLSHVLQLPSLAPIRAILAGEPIINDKPYDQVDAAAAAFRAILRRPGVYAVAA